MRMRAIHSEEAIEDLIRWSDEVAGPLPPAARQYRASGKIKPDEDDRALWAWIREHCGPTNWCDGHPLNGRPMPPTSETVERHLNAGGWQGRLATLKLGRVAAYRRGGLPLHLKPLRDRDRPVVVIRLDADAHDGEPDAAQLVERLSETFFDHRLYQEPSRRGHSGYLVVEITPFPDLDGRTIHPGARRINADVDAMQAALSTLAGAWGFKAKIEVNGRFMQLGTRDDGTRTVVNAGRWFRAPRCPNAGDVQRLLGSRFGDAVIRTLVSAAGGFPALAGAPATAPVPAAARAAPAPARRTSQRNELEDAGDVFTNRVNVAAVVKAEWVRGHEVSGFDDDVLAAMVERANTLYESAELARGRRDAARDGCFRSLFRGMMRTHDRDACGSGLWFDDPDLEYYDTLIRSRTPRWKLKKLNADNAVALDGRKLDYRKLTYIACTFGKNTNTRDGHCPMTALIGMLGHYGMSANGTLVRLATDVLIHIGLVERTQASYKPGRWCRKYRMVGRGRDAPFIVHLKSDQHDAGGARRHIPRAGRPGVMPTFRPSNNSQDPSILAGGPAACISDEASEAADDGYWSNLEGVAEEYVPN
jgi:hypothetical protein